MWCTARTAGRARVDVSCGVLPILNRHSTDHPGGKLRLLYEAVPLAFLAEQAGGRASDGNTDILDIQPQELHQRTPLFIGNAPEVDRICGLLAPAD